MEITLFSSDTKKEFLITEREAKISNVLSTLFSPMIKHDPVLPLPSLDEQQLDFFTRYLRLCQGQVCKVVIASPKLRKKEKKSDIRSIFKRTNKIEQQVKAFFEENFPITLSSSREFEVSAFNTEFLFCKKLLTASVYLGLKVCYDNLNQCFIEALRLQAWQVK